DMREFLDETLGRLGHRVVSVADTGQQLIEACRAEHPDLVITDIRMPELDGLDAAQAIYEIQPVPIIVITAHYDAEFIQRAQERHVLAFLVKPIDEEDLAPAIAIAQGRFDEFQALRQENQTLSQALQDRKIIERAKGLLMKQGQMDEAAAFKRLQKLARDQRKKMAEVAQMIVTALEAISPRDKEKTLD
ncbi:MAG: ANTAR domain-containing response regulator, partial [Pirellulaceae bacterium]